MKKFRSCLLFLLILLGGLFLLVACGGDEDPENGYSRQSARDGRRLSHL